MDETGPEDVRLTVDEVLGEEEAAQDPSASGESDDVEQPRHRPDPFELLFLSEPANVETITLLMRGMPLPCTYGFPGTNGTMSSNYVQFVYNFHPLISIFTAHPLHPFTRKERFVVFVCSVAFNMLWSTYLAFHRNKVVDLTDDRRDFAGLWFLTTKHICIVLYAVLIRQLVICPCPYNALLDKLQHARDDRDITGLRHAAERLIRAKVTGDRIIVWLLILHLVAIASVLAWLATWQVDRDAERRVQHHTNPASALASIALSEVYNFLVWFIKFLPLFLALYPIHRDAWFTRGQFREYLTCTRHCNQYLRSPNFKNPEFPRCVAPVDVRASKTASLKSIFTDISKSTRSHHGFHLSTIRTNSELDLRSAVREQKKPDSELDDVKES